MNISSKTASTAARLLIVACLWAAPAIAAAGVLGDLTQMFMSNASGPKATSSQDRAGVFGGSVQLRAPILAINLVAFDPPRFDAGCGGIDLYGGSFSFINSQQLVQIFRQVAANAVGLAFKAAVNAIAPSLSSLMTEFQTLMQHLNSLAKNSCQLASVAVNSADRALGGAVNGQGSIGAAQTGLFSDTFASLNSYLTNADSYLKSAGTVNPKVGNATMKAILNSGASAMMGLAGMTNIDSSADDATNPSSLNNRLLVSLMGYEVSGLPCTNISADGVADSQSPPSGSTLSNVTCSGANTITLLDMIEGGGAGSVKPNLPLKLYDCANPAGNGSTAAGADAQPCTAMRVSNFDYPGIRGYVNTALFGTPDASSAPTAGSILGQFTAQKPVALTTPQLALLRGSGIPLMGLLSRTRSAATRVSIAQRLSEHVITCVAASVGEALHKAANSTQLGGENNLSPEVKARIEALRLDYLKQRDGCIKDHAVLDVVQEINASLQLASIHPK